MDWTFSDDELAMAKHIVATLDTARKSGEPVNELFIIAEGLSDYIRAKTYSN